MKNLILLLLFIPILISGQSATAENQIIVTGTSEMEIEPDWVELSMTDRETENTRKESDVVFMEKTILIYLTSIGIDTSCFSIIRYSANTKYNSSSGSKFQMNKSYLLRVNNLKYLDKIIEKCLDAGMDNVQIKGAGHSQIDSYRNQLLQDALKNAQDKAVIIAKAMGVNLGKVIFVEENYYPPQIVNLGSEFYANAISYETRQSRYSSSLGYQKIDLNKTVLVKFAIQ
jgi:uncharacterized protein YggE